MREPLVLPAGALIAGILLERSVGFEPAELAIAIAAFAALSLAAVRAREISLAIERVTVQWRPCRLPGAPSGPGALWARRHRRPWLLAGACYLLGMVGAGALASRLHRPGPPPELEPPPPALMTLEGCVVAPSALSEDRARFLLELAPGARVQVTLYAAHAAAGLPRLDYGQRVELEARVRRPHNFRNPGGFDYVRYLARRDIHWTASARAGRPPRILPGSCGRAWLAPVMRLRVWMLRRIRQLYPGERYNAGMMQALLIGESFQLEKIWTERFRSTGTYHALVISGTHVAVLAGFFLFLLRLCFLPPRWAALATVLAAWLYALVAGWQPPVIRSAAGLSLFLIGRYFGRAPRVLNLLAAVAILFLLLDPEQLFEPSFQLSFLAVAAIAALAMPLIERTSAPLARGLGRLRDLTLDMRAAPRVAQFRLEVRLLADTLGLWTAGKWRGPPAERHLPSRIQQFCDLAFTAPLRLGLYAWELFLLSALVQIGLALPMIVYFHRAGLSGLSANIFVVPLTGILIPAGFVAVLSGSQIAAAFCAGLLALIGRIVGWHALLEPAWRIPAPPLWLAIALAAFLVAAASLAGRRRWRLAAAAGVAVSLALLFWHPFRPQLARKSLELTAIDVGQGESLLVGFPQGRLMLVDGGGIVSFSGREPRLDIGEDVVSPYLWSRSIRRIDVLALTHAHQDHIGGAAALIENFSIGEIWTGAMPPGGAWETLRRRAAQRRIPLRSLRRGPPFGYAGAGIEVLAPSPGYAPAAAARNNDSLVLRVSFGRHAFLLSGDIDRRLEKELAPLVPKLDLLKVAHHGSDSSSSEEFLAAVRPAFALISAGPDNPYRHPHPNVLARLADARAQIYRTDRQGLVSILSDGLRIRVQTAQDLLPSRVAQPRPIPGFLTRAQPRPRPPDPRREPRQ